MVNGIRKMSKYIYIIFLMVILLAVMPPVSVIAYEVLGIDVISSRPMAEATTALAEQLGCVITYEDPPFQHESDVTPTFPGSEGLIPSSGEISYDYEKAQGKNEIILGLIAAHHAQGNTGEFTLTKTKDTYNVFPVRYRNRQGLLVNHKSVLDTKVTLLLKNKSFFDTVKDLCALLSQSNPNYHVAAGNVPQNAFRGITFPRDINNESARTLLNEITDIYNKTNSDSEKQLTWQLRFGPVSDENKKPRYALCFRALSRSDPNSMRLITISQRPMAAAAKLLERRFGVIITYEDPPFVCPCDLMGHGAVKSLAGGIMSLNWKAGKSIDDTLNLLVSTQIMPRENPVSFKVNKSGDRYHIYPHMSKDEQGSLVLRSSIMNQNITLNKQDINGLVAIESICSNISNATGKNIVMETLPSAMKEKLTKNIFSKISENNRGSCDILNQILEATDYSISWQLHFDPSTKYYKLIFHDITNGKS